VLTSLEIIMQFSSNQYREPKGWRPQVDGMQFFMGDLEFDTQNAFIRGREIVDFVLIENCFQIVG
jgi:hypothetical protein